jgi:hypothetical protein
MTNFGVVAKGSPESKIATNARGVTTLDHRPNIPGPYVYVLTGDPDFDTGQSPEWENDFTWFETAYVGFRHGLDGYTEFIGKLDLTAGAVTGTVAFKLPVAYRSIGFDYTFPIFAGGTDWQSGVMSVNPLGDGDVYVYWPVQATAI